MYIVYWTNHFYSSPEEFQTVEAALRYVKSAGMEGAVQIRGGKVVASYGVLRGVTHYPCGTE